MGGLEKIVPSWVSDAESLHLGQSRIETIAHHLSEYSNLDQEGRARVIGKLLAMLEVSRTELLAPSPLESMNINVEVRGTVQSPSATKPPLVAPTQQNVNKRPHSTAETLGLNAPLTVIPGVGTRHAQTLRSLGLNTLGDILYYLPRRYDDYSQLKPINHLEYGEELTVIAEVESINNRAARGGQLQITEATVSDGTGCLRLTWFNQPWLANRLKPGSQVVLSGKVEMYLGRLVMNSPEVEELEQQHLHTNRIVPVYPLSARITQRWLRRLMHQTVSFWAPRSPDYLPQSVLESAKLIELPNALLQIHFPTSHEALQAARSRLAFDEIFLLQLGVLRQKRNWQSGVAQVIESPDGWIEGVVSKLPFPLTSAQHKALTEIGKDLTSGHPMNRLLQGDVGSGKTVIATLAIALVTRAGYQAAFMAPTSILAEQHYRSLSNLLANGNSGANSLNPDQICLLIGDTPEPEKRQIRERLTNGEVKLVIGTHALIEDPVAFNNLQLVVIDEQHRFGVEQRSLLRSKGNNPHLLLMTATPIPRSLALTIYGDLDLTVMDEMPIGRQPVETDLIHPLERERAYELIRNQVKVGRQAFIIYPLVEQGERGEVKAAVEEHARLQQEVFPSLSLGLLHGRLKADEKNHVMNRFYSGEHQILVSTSVVEVGVDVSNATVMLIEGANRFGLSQLHQFCGRVGRGQDKAHCLLIPETEDALENERLQVMEETNDGFILAERDLEQRGPGD
ncbi:MAG: ATP-dependent DNA helicase RecG, partial [Anaerolineaceae bacterium]|nr:ATP-dependent DNA helicase RecG [Anaerolineaceae bacterium]